MFHKRSAVSLLSVRNTLRLRTTTTRPVLALRQTPYNITMPLRPLLTISNSILESLKKEEIFEDVLPQFTPKGLLQVSYGGNNEVALGNTLSVAETKSKPKVQFVLDAPTNSSEEGVNITEQDRFTLVLTDPDAPSRTDKKWSEYAHFIASDISLKNTADAGADFLAAEIDLGAQDKELLEYVGPAPPAGTGKHRYVFLLYKQAGVSPQAPKDRLNWGYGSPATGVLKWSEEYSLEPWAVNFFYAENKG